MFPRVTRTTRRVSRTNISKTWNIRLAPPTCTVDNIVRTFAEGRPLFRCYYYYSSPSNIHGKFKLFSRAPLNGCVCCWWPQLHLFSTLTHMRFEWYGVVACLLRFEWEIKFPSSFIYSLLLSLFAHVSISQCDCAWITIIIIVIQTVIVLVVNTPTNEFSEEFLWQTLHNNNCVCYQSCRVLAAQAVVVIQFRFGIQSARWWSCEKREWTILEPQATSCNNIITTEINNIILLYSCPSDKIINKREILF